MQTSGIPPQRFTLSFGWGYPLLSLHHKTLLYLRVREFGHKFFLNQSVSKWHKWKVSAWLLQALSTLFSLPCSILVSLTNGASLSTGFIFDSAIRHHNSGKRIDIRVFILLVELHSLLKAPGALRQIAPIFKFGWHSTTRPTGIEEDYNCSTSLKKMQLPFSCSQNPTHKIFPSTSCCAMWYFVMSQFHIAVHVHWYFEIFPCLTTHTLKEHILIIHLSLYFLQTLGTIHVACGYSHRLWD